MAPSVPSSWRCGWTGFQSWLVMIVLIASRQIDLIEGSMYRPQQYSGSSSISSERQGGKHNHFRYSRKETISFIDAALLQTRGGARKATSTTAENLASIIANGPPDSQEASGEETIAAEDSQDIIQSISESEGDVEVAVENDATEDPTPQTEVDSSISPVSSPPLGEDTEEEPSNSNMLPDCDKPVSEVLEEAAALRQRGKESHEEGKFAIAAMHFHQAANLLEACLDKEDLEEINEVDAEEANQDDNSIDITSSSEATSSSSVNLQDEWATCRLHESLCHLKAEDYQKCVEACSSLLESAPENHTPAAMIRARAHHRRAKALVALGDTDEALVDARSAAFLGERKAVTFYGKLLRDTGGSDSSFLSSSSPMGGLTDPSTSKLLESLLSKSSPHSDDSGGSDFMSSSLLSSMAGSFLSPGGLGGAKGSGGGGGMAKSIINSLSKKLEDESTHEGICQYLQSTNPMAIQSMASMAGIELSSGHANSLVKIAHGITPKTIRRTVKTSKRVIWGFQLIRKTMAVLSKYRHVLFLLMLLQWTKSALLRPAPMPKIKAAKAPKLPKQAAKAKPSLNANANQNANNNPNAANGGQAKNRKPKTPGLLNPLGAAAQR